MRPQPMHILIIVALIVLLFGAGKLPSLARNLGKSMRIFKSEVEELRGEDTRKKDDDLDELDEVTSRRRDEPVRERSVADRAREYDVRDRDRDLETVRRADEDRYRRD